MKQKALFTCAAIIVGISVLLLAYLALAPYIDYPARDLSKDIDWGYLNRGLDQIHSFRDTGRWWTGIWCGGIPFWRPLTSYFLWTERLLWPKEYMLPRQIIHIVLHLVFVGMAGYLAWKLTGRRWLTLITVWLFAGFRPYPVARLYGYNFAVYDLLSDPKNVPDPLAGIALATSLLLLRRGKWLGSLAAAITAVGFKEIGFTIWPLAVVMLIWIHRRDMRVPGYALSSLRRNRLPILVWLSAFLLLALVRFHAIGLKSDIGVNRVTALWMGHFFGGPLFGEMLQRNYGPVVIGLLTISSAMGLRRFSLPIRLLGILASLFVGVLIDARLWGTSWDVSAAASFYFEADEAIAIVIWVYIAIQGIRDRGMIAFALAMSLVATIPTWLIPWAFPHTRYVAAFFLEMAVAAALLSTIEHIWKTKRAITE